MLPVRLAAAVSSRWPVRSKRNHASVPVSDRFFLCFEISIFKTSVCRRMQRKFATRIFYADAEIHLWESFAPKILRPTHRQWARLSSSSLSSAEPPSSRRLRSPAGVCAGGTRAKPSNRKWRHTSGNRGSIVQFSCVFFSFTDPRREPRPRVFSHSSGLPKLASLVVHISSLQGTRRRGLSDPRFLAIGN